MQVADVKNGNYQLKAYTTIQDIDSFLWDSILSSQDLFKTHRFIQVIEEARVENSRFWHLLIYENKKLVITCSLSAFTISLDLFVSGFLKKLIVWLRNFFPGFLKINILFCGLPISIGTNNLAFSNDQSSPVVLKMITDFMDRLCIENKIHYLCFKEFKESEIKNVDHLDKLGYFKAPSLPYVSLSIPWENYQEYLSCLRHPYRRKIKRVLRKINRSIPGAIQNDDVSSESDYPLLMMDEKIPFDPRLFYEMYLNVMERAAVKLETLNMDFFRNFFEKMRGDYKIIYIKFREDILGCAIVTTQNNTLTFLLIGLTRKIDKKYNTYANILYGIVHYAIASGFKKLNLGQTAYWLKQQAGGECEPVYIYIKIRKPLISFMIRSMKSIIFPETRTFRFRTFRTDHSHQNQ